MKSPKYVESATLFMLAHISWCSNRSIWNTGCEDWQQQSDTTTNKINSANLTKKSKGELKPRLHSDRQVSNWLGYSIFDEQDTTYVKNNSKFRKYGWLQCKLLSCFVQYTIFFFCKQSFNSALCNFVYHISCSYHIKRDKTIQHDLSTVPSHPTCSQH
jgi:hypothetical protein